MHGTDFKHIPSALSPARHIEVSRRERFRGGGPDGEKSSRSLMKQKTNPVILYTFFAFIFSIPFQEAYVAGGATLSKLLGIALAAAGFLQPQLCYRVAPKAFWVFGTYLVVLAAWSSYLLLDPPNVPNFSELLRGQFLTLLQLLILFWISYNLLRQEDVVIGTLWAFTAGTILLAVLQLAGITSDVSNAGRIGAFEGNPNGLAVVLSLGLLTLFGVAYGQQKEDRKAVICFWLSSGFLLVAIVHTGSRGALIALVMSLSVFLLHGKSVATKLKFGVIGSMAVIILVVASFRIEAVRHRWEKTFYDDDIGGRESIYSAAVMMILERPMIGWGPINHLWELGPRVGWPYRDEHNVYLWILAEVGVLGAIPFLAGLWLCWRSAWRSRNGRHGMLPLVLLLFLLAVSMKGTVHKEKYYWLVLSISLAASRYGPGARHLRPGGLLAERRSRNRSLSVRFERSSATTS